MANTPFVHIYDHRHNMTKPLSIRELANIYLEIDKTYRERYNPPDDEERRLREIWKTMHIFKLKEILRREVTIARDTTRLKRRNYGTDENEVGYS